MAKICSIVFNSISSDARVLKEAHSLQKAGHAVTVLGLTDENNLIRKETLTTGVMLLRLDLQAARKFVGVVTTGGTRVALLSLSLLLIVFALYSLTGLLWALFWGAVTGIVVSLLTVLFITIVQVRLYYRRIFDIEGDEDPQYSGGILFFLYAIKDAVPLFVRSIPMYLMVRRLQPEILHCHDVSTLPVGIMAKWLLRCRVVYDAHEIYEEVALASAERARAYRLIHKLGQRRVDAFITINESIAAWYAAHYPSMPPAVLIKNATSPSDSIDYDGRLHEASTQQRDRKILLYQGGFASKRGLEYVVKSAAYLSDEWVLVMMGWGSFEPRLRDLAEEINLARSEQGRPEAVVFIRPAPQEELALWSAGGTVGIIPYENIGLNHWFCTPNKLWEYPNAGVPVLVSPFPELSAPVLKYGYGWLLPDEQDPEALAKQVVSLSDEQIAEARKNCGKFINQDNWGVYESRLVDLYRGISEK